MKFTIIIPTYNSEKFIRQCLEAIIELEYPRDQYEIIIVDGGSSDNTIGIIKTFPNVNIFSSTNISISNSRNIGASKAKGENLAFIDSDCLVNKKLLLKSEKHLNKYECCGSFYRSSDTHGWIAKTWLIAEEKKTGTVAWITSGTLIIRRDVFIEIGGFNELLQTEEDENLGYRIRMNGGKIFNDMSMASIHLGQSDHFFNFFLKEVWRGKSLIKAADNKCAKKYTIFDFLIIFASLNFCFLLLSVFFSYRFGAYLAILIILVLPFLLSVRKCLQTKKIKYISRLYILYFVFLFARISSIFWYMQFLRIFNFKRHKDCFQR